MSKASKARGFKGRCSSSAADGYGCGGFRSKGSSSSRFDNEFQDFSEFQVTSSIKSTPLVAKTEAQQRYINAIKNFQIVFGIGPAGTGKSYCAASLAAEFLKDKTFDKIILTRPAVGAGEDFGFLPGELEEKYEPYLTPLRAILEEKLGKSHVENLLKLEKIKPIPLGFMKGLTFDNAIVLLDEAQDVTPKQMKTFLTRIGRNCKVVIDGDLRQKDVLSISGLEDAIKRISYIPSVKVVSFTKADVVRSDIVGEIIQAYDED